MQCIEISDYHSKPQVTPPTSTPFMTSEAPPLLLFVNPSSGGGLGDLLIKQVQTEPSIHFVKLPQEASTFPEIYRDLLQNPELRCIAAGGDGTVNWVVNLLSGIFGFEATNESQQIHRPPLAVIPLGTGNDMSRSLGWGRGLTKNQMNTLPGTIKQIRESTHIENTDVWNISFQKVKDNSIIDKTMLNYFSIGVDAEIAHNFESCRKGKCGCCICCQCMSLTCYVPVALRSLCCKRPIRNYLTVDIQTENPEPTEEKQEVDQSLFITRRLEASRSEKTFVIQAIPSIYAGRDLWGDHSPKSMSDGKFEVLTEGGVFRLGFAQIGCSTAKPFCQGISAKIKIDEPIYYQIDGEGAYENDETICTITRKGSYPLMFCTKQ